MTTDLNTASLRWRSSPTVAEVNAGIAFLADVDAPLLYCEALLRHRPDRLASDSQSKSQLRRVLASDLVSDRRLDEWISLPAPPPVRRELLDAKERRASGLGRSIARRVVVPVVLSHSVALLDGPSPLAVPREISVKPRVVGEAQSIGFPPTWERDFDVIQRLHPSSTPPQWHVLSQAYGSGGGTRLAAEDKSVLLGCLVAYVIWCDELFALPSIACTGTISADGVVGDVGRLDLKLWATATQATDARYFLVPAGAVVPVVRSEVAVVPVSSVADVVRWLHVTARRETNRGPPWYRCRIDRAVVEAIHERALSADASTRADALRCAHAMVMASFEAAGWSGDQIRSGWLDAVNWATASDLLRGFDPMRVDEFTLLLGIDGELDAAMVPASPLEVARWTRELVAMCDEVCERAALRRMGLPESIAAKCLARYRVRIHPIRSRILGEFREVEERLERIVFAAPHDPSGVDAAISELLRWANEQVLDVRDQLREARHEIEIDAETYRRLSDMLLSYTGVLWALGSLPDRPGIASAAFFVSRLLLIGQLLKQKRPRDGSGDHFLDDRLMSLAVAVMLARFRRQGVSNARLDGLWTQLYKKWKDRFNGSPSE